MQSLDIKGLEQQLTVLAAQNDSRLKAIEEWENAMQGQGQRAGPVAGLFDVTVKHNSKKAELEVNRQGLKVNDPGAS